MLDNNGRYNDTNSVVSPTVLPDGDSKYTPCPDLMTEDELIRFLRIPKISKAKDLRSVITNLKRFRDLPCVHICRQPLYPREAVMEWLKGQTK